MRAHALIREAGPADFPAIIEVWKAQGIAWPERAASAAALHGEDYVGLKEVGMLRDSGAIQCGLMAVLPPFQRLGLARAMQLRTVEYAKRIGCHALKSCTATLNRPMLELYGKLGYRRLYEWGQFQREVRGGPSVAYRFSGLPGIPG